MKQLTPYEQTQLARYGNNGQYPLDEVKDMPIEYVTGVAEFCGLPFRVNTDVLIPRIETEELVELGLQVISEKLPTAHSTSPLTIADVGTGSGAVIVSIAKHLQDFAVKTKLFASDISADALLLAQENAQTFLDLEKQPIRFIESHLLSAYPLDVKFDLIMANLPYIPSSRIEKLDVSVKDFEPKRALDGGPRGLDLIAQLLEQAPKYLQTNGVVLLEIDETHSLPDFQQFAQNFQVSVIQDSFAKNRFVELRYTRHGHTA